MSLKTAAKFARRELRGGIKGFRIFLACLTLGVAAIAGVGSVKSAIQAGLSDQGAVLLGGDAEAQFTYRFATDEERAWLESRSTALSEVTDFRSMVVVGEGDTAERGLTQVKSVDDAYPLLGDMMLSPDIPLPQALDGTAALPGAVMAPLLADRLGIAPGDTFKLADKQFHLSAVIETEPDDTGGGFSLGPRTMVRTTDLIGTGLLEPGTLFETEYRMLLPEGTDLDAIKAEAEDRYRDTGIRWRDSRNGAPGTARFVDRMGAFLVLVGLSGLAVGGIGVSAAVRAYLSRKTSVIATLRTLGASRATIFQTYFLQIGALSLVGIVLGLILGALIPVVFSPLITASLPVPAMFGIHPAPLFEAAIYGVLAALLFTLWPLARTDEVRAATLFRDAWYILTPGPSTDEAYLAGVDALTHFWQALGSKVETMDSARHDRVLAITSHLPHLIAFNIVATAFDMETVEQGEVVKYSAGGFRDFTRIAASDPVMWRDVFLTNKEAVLECLGRFSEDLAVLQRAIRWGDGDRLMHEFTRARTIRKAIIDAGQDSSAVNFGRNPLPDKETGES